MYNFLSKLVLALTETELKKIAQPLITFCDTVVPVALVLVSSLGSILVIILGVKYAKADDPQEHEKAKNGLKNAIVGFVLIFVLLIALKVGFNVFSDWFSSYDFS